jgi:hypothetical protein
MVGAIPNGTVWNVAVERKFMDVLTQQCAVCGVLKTDANNTADKPWTRISGVTLGSSPQPIQVFRPPTPGQPRVQGMNWSALDFCPACAAKTTVDAVPALYSAKVSTPATKVATAPPAIATAAPAAAK